MSKLRADLTIDFHAHMLEPHAFEQATGRTVLTGFGTRKSAHAPPGTTVYDIFQKMLDPARQIEDMDRLGIGINVISSSTVMAGTSWADLPTECVLIKRINDRAAEWCALYPDRFVGSFVLPLRDMKLAMSEFDRSVGDLGLRVANVSSNYGGLYLGHPQFSEFWERAQATKTIVFIHPEGTHDLWFQDFSLWNSVGQPIEEAKVMASIIYEGIFEKYPEIKIVMAHGGGYLPHYFGRLDRNVTNMPESVKNISRKPSDYLRSFYYDTCTYNPQVIKNLISVVGVERLVMGSDYAVGEADPIGFLKTIPELDDSGRRMIMGTTPATLLDVGRKNPTT